MPASRPEGARAVRPGGDGARAPVGAVREPVHRQTIAESHARSAAGGLSRIERPDFSLIGRSDLALALERNRRLHVHSVPVMAMLLEHVVHTQSMIVLSDAAGTVLHSVGAPDFLDRAAQVALRPGADWSEPAKGTNAIGTALVAEAPVLVHADEHYLHANHFLTCSAAPILDPRGQVLGVLDVSGDQRSYHPHTMAMVTMSVRMIENHWLADEGRHLLRLHFHEQPAFLGTLLEGIVTIAPDGRIAGANRAATELLGLPAVALRRLDAEALFQARIDTLIDAARSGRRLALTARDGRALAGVAQVDAAARPLATSPAPPIAAPIGPPRAAPAARSSAAPAPVAAAWADWASDDPAVRALVRRVQTVADDDLPLLLLGETGSGKEHLARSLHAASRRACEPFVVLAGSGAFAPPVAGTLFLDGVDDWSAARQAELQAWIDELERRPPDALRPRLVTALRLRPGQGADAVGARLGDPLAWRLAGLALTLPPLRVRSDLPALAQRLLERHAPGRAPLLAPATLERLAAQDWPGNLRQLAHALRAALAQAGPDAPTLEPEHLPPDLQAPAPSARSAAASLKDLELEAIRRAVQACDGNVSQAARRLGISRNTIYRRLGRDG